MLRFEILLIKLRFAELLLNHNLGYHDKKPNISQSRYIESITCKSGLSKPVISYQYLHLKTIYTDCIYRKIDKTSKRQTLWNGFALIENDITIG